MAVASHHVETVGPDDLHALAIGAAVLGTGGGGNPRIGELRMRSLLENDEYPDSVDVIDPTDLPDDATVVSVAGIGAPTIGVEKLPEGHEEIRSLRRLEAVADVSVDAIVPGEIGGANSMVPPVVAAQTGLPVVDGDGMGRAFPELQMDTFFIYGAEPDYAAFTDERGNQAVYLDIDSPERLEDLGRAATIEFGGRAGSAFPVMSGAHVKRSAIPNTLSLALEVGQGILSARSEGADPVDRVCSITGATELFEGKVVDVFRRNREGFAKGEFELEALAGAGRLEVEFQNEFLIARNEAGEALVTVPDLICVLDRETGEPITTETLRYGQRVRVIGVPAPELLKTDRALSVIGPEAFGYDEPYDPL